MIQRISTPEIDAAIADIVRAAENEAIAGVDRLTDLHESEYVEESALGLNNIVASKVVNLVASITPGADYVQRTPNLRLHMPGAPSAIPFHSDHLYGHSQHETNYWLVLTPAWGTNSLWMANPSKTEMLHDALRGGESLAEFEELARFYSEPIKADGPGLYAFCCRDVHGSVPNDTDSTRVSFDIRTIPADVPMGVKRRGGYFKSLWMGEMRCPAHPLDRLTTVASLDLGARVDHQRAVMQAFHPQSGHRELVEFHGLDHAPTLDDAMANGPVIIYSIRQLKKIPTLLHPLGCADERAWFLPGDDSKLERLWRECQ